MNRVRKIRLEQLNPMLSFPEAELLCTAGAKPEGMTVSALAEALDQPMPAVSRTMRALEARGLILRTILPQDRRNIIVTVTDSGREICQTFYQNLNSFFQELLSKMDPAEFDRMLANMNCLLDQMELQLQDYLNRQTESDPGEENL